MGTKVFDLPIPAVKALLSNDDDNIKKQCLEYVAALIEVPDLCKDLLDSGETISVILSISEHPNELSKLALECLINIASTENGATAIFTSDEKIQGKSSLILLKIAVNQGHVYAEHASTVLTNMTRWESLALKISEVFISEDNLLRSVFEAIRNKKYNALCVNLSTHLTQLLGNLTQSTDFQNYLVTAEDGFLFCSILSLINHGETVLQRRGIVSTLHNCLFTPKNHLLLLNPPFSILSYLLYPLAGPEEFDDDEVEKLPVELQYLDCQKEREPDMEIKKLLLQSLLKLCDSKQGRTFLRDNQTYLILREYHKWEKNSNLVLACENVVDILIRTEDEIGLDMLSSVNVPENMIKNFEEMDADFTGAANKVD